MDDASRPFDGRQPAAVLDAFDRKILRLLQEDATVTVAEIGRAVGLSSTPCWKRIQRLEAIGVIQKRVAILAPEKLGLSVGVQVNIQTGNHTPDAVDAFIAAVRAMPEVLQFQRLAGDIDFCLRVVATDIKDYERIYRKLTSLMPLRRVSSYFELQQLKSETALPLEVVSNPQEETESVAARQGARAAPTEARP